MAIYVFEPDGIASPESFITENQILVNKKSPDVMNNQSLFGDTKTSYFDSELVYRNSTTSVVDKVTISNNDDDVVIKVLYRQMRPPIVGTSSVLESQKGVIGAIFNKAIMPFTCDEISPDTIMNPHGFISNDCSENPKEMTAAKAAALKGTIHDATVFGGTDMNHCFKIMKKHHRMFSGKELVVSGITGELMPDEVYIGPIYYQRLKHMVSDKVHSRLIGPMTSLTRAPANGGPIA